jgi:glucose/arabinose dehydrogenase
MKKTSIALLCAVLTLLPLPSHAVPKGTKVQTYRSGLDFPIDMAWVKGTRKVFVTEKNTGRIRVLIGKRLLDRPCTTLPVANGGEQGALGIALHPNFNSNNYLYVMYTNSSPEVMKVTRFTVRKNRCRNSKKILSGVPAGGGYHNGGQIEFIGDKLFVSTGENHDASLAQNRNNRSGKVLRLNDDGSVPSDNPFSSPGDPNPVWSYGHRNPFGLAANPRTGKLYESENGPSCDDEVNLIEKGNNYGWGANYDPDNCGTAGVGNNPTPPLKRWTPTIVPTDLWWYFGKMKSLSGDLYMGDYDGHLHRFVLNDAGTEITSDRIIYTGGGVVDVSEGPGGWLYFIEGDSLKRIVPR